MISIETVNVFLNVASSYNKQSMKKYTLNFRDKLVEKLSKVKTKANILTNDEKKEIINDNFLSKYEYDFLILVALESKDDSAVNTISNYISD